MTDKKIERHSIDELSISDYSKRALKEQLNYSDLECLLSFMLHMPDASKTYFRSLGLNYDKVKKQIYGILPEDKIKYMEEYEKNPYQHTMGALPPLPKKK